MASIDPYLPLIEELTKLSKNVLEIGVHRANTTKTILSALHDESSLTSLDLIDPIDFESNSTKWKFVKCDCLDYNIDKEMDFLLIDCDPVLSLFEKIMQKYGKFVKKFIAVHDTRAYHLEQYLVDWAYNNNFKIKFHDKEGLGFMVIEND